MFEYEIEIAPPGSDRKANYTIAKGIVKAIEDLTQAVTESVRTNGLLRETETVEAVPSCDPGFLVPTPEPVPFEYTDAPEKPFPHFDTTTTDGPTPNSTDLTAPVNDGGNGPVPNSTLISDDEPEVSSDFTRNTADGGL